MDDRAIPPPRLPARLSASALERYRQCPRRFYFHDIEKRAGREQRGLNLCIGIAVHAALERFFGLEPSDRSREGLEDCLRAVWRKHCPRELFTSVAQEHDVGAGALRLLRRFVEGFDTSVQPLARERWVQATLPNGARIYGKVDRIDVRVHLHRPATLELVDYKTGRQGLEGRDLAEEAAVQVYVVATEAVVGRAVERVRYLYLGSCTDSRFDLEREDVELARTRLVTTTDRLRSDREFEPLPGPHCRGCRFRGICPAATA